MNIEQFCSYFFTSKPMIKVRYPDEAITLSVLVAFSNNQIGVPTNNAYNSFLILGAFP